MNEAVEVDTDNIKENKMPGRCVEDVAETIAEEARDSTLDPCEFYIGKNKTTRWYLEPHKFLKQLHYIMSNFHIPGPKRDTTSGVLKPIIIKIEELKNIKK